MIIITDRKLTPKLIVDVYTSLIWHKKHKEAGDFELYFPAGMYSFEDFEIGDYIFRDDDGLLSNMICVIEKITISQDAEGTDFVTVSGRSTLALLDKRVYMEHKTFYKTEWTSDGVNIPYEVSEIIKKVQRERPIFEAGFMANPAALVPVQPSYTPGFGKTLYDIVTEVCATYSIGTRIRISSDKSSLIFEFYGGTTTDIKPVTFSAEFNNLLSSELTTDIQSYGNKAFVAGEGEGTDRKIVTVTAGEFSSYDTYEVFVDARDLQKTTKDEKGQDVTLSDTDYEAALKSRGLQKLYSDYPYKKTLSCDIVNAGQYVYGVDYDIGDIVTVSTPYTSPQKARVIGVTESFDENGHTFLPDLELI